MLDFVYISIRMRAGGASLLTFRGDDFVSFCVVLLSHRSS